MSLASQLSFLESSTSTLQQINNNFVIASNSGVSNTTTGALQITNGGLAVGGGVFVGGTVTATTFVGSFSGSITGSAAQVNTIQQVSSATYYPVFVDSNNASSTGEIVYTTSSFVISPARGNVGFGVIPSNWGGIASNVLEFKGGGHMFGVAADNYFSVGSNAWYDGTNWRYKVSGRTATMYHQDTGRHEFFSAPSGTADATISGWVNRFQINDTGAIAFSSSGNGTSGQVLQSNGNAPPSWVNPTAATATNLAGGTAGQLHYQSAVGVTAFAGPGTAGQLLVSAGTSAPTYTNTGSIYVGAASSAVNLFGGSAGQFHYQSAAGITAFISTGSMYVNRATVADSANSISGAVTTATNIAGGTAGQLHYQSAVGLTAFAGPGTAGQLLVSAGAAAPTYTNTGSIYVGAASSSVNLFGGSAGQFAYQTGAGATSFVSTSSMYVNRATVADSVSGGSSQVNTIQQTSSATYFPTFVDANNASAAAESVYTTSSFAINPSTGNVGIGTNSPIWKLHVQTASSGTDGIYVASAVGGNAFFRPNNSTGANNSIVLQGDAGIIYSSSGGINTGGFVIAPWATATSGIRLDSSGNLGIGTSTPTNAGAGYKFITAFGSTGSNYQAYGGSLTDARFFADNGYGGTGMFSNHPYLFYTNSSERIRITANGGVAFGGASNYGSSGQVLQSNGDAAPTWVNPTANSVTNSVTFNNSGAGDASGTTYNGSSARTISFNTVGAARGIGASGGANLNTLTTSGMYRIEATEANRPGDYGQLLVMHGAGDTITQIYGQYSNGVLYTRSGNPSDVSGVGTWTSWHTVLDNTNYNSYSPTLTGTGASGTWGINISGTATNIAGGTAMSVHYQSAAGTTAFLAAGTAGQVLQTNGTGTAPTWVDISSGLFTRITTNTTVLAGSKIIADTAGGVFTLTLPALPATGAAVEIVDGANWTTNNLTIGRNGQTIEGSASDLVLNTGGARVMFVYDGTTWEVYTTTSSGGGSGVTIGKSIAMAIIFG